MLKIVFLSTLVSCATLFLSWPLHASPKTFMRCLGTEEAKLHREKKDTPIYKLNQELIHALVQLRSSISLSSAFAKEICSSSSPSLKMLELILTEEALLQTSLNKRQNAQYYAIDISSIEQLKQESIFIFINFVAKTQAQLSKPGCLQHYIPELGDFLEKMQFLLENKDPKQILDSLERPKTVFNKLRELIAKTQVRCP